MEEAGTLGVRAHYLGKFGALSSSSCCSSAAPLPLRGAAPVSVSLSLTTSPSPLLALPTSISAPIGVGGSGGGGGGHGAEAIRVANGALNGQRLLRLLGRGWQNKAQRGLEVLEQGSPFLVPIASADRVAEFAAQRRGDGVGAQEAATAQPARVGGVDP